MNAAPEVVVVGAGPAGLAAAITLARLGVRVVVFERGEYPGAKNMFGGMVYTRRLESLLPGLWEDAPWERVVTRHRFLLLTDDASLAMEYRNQGAAEPPFNAATVLRTRFDRYLADQASAAGALIVPGTVVDDLLWEGDRVVGVQVRRDQGAVQARLVIAADGIQSRLALRAGLRGPLAPQDVALGVKELWALPEKRIRERCGLIGREGASYTYLGAATDGLPGAGFLYTNRDSLSFGIVIHLAALKSSGRTPASLLDGLRSHPCVRDILQGATLLEYSAHLVPERGLRMMPRLYRSGILLAGDAGAMALSTGLVTDGVGPAVASGVCAAETAFEALGLGKFDEQALASYPRRLRESFVMPELETFARMPDLLTSSRIYSVYPQLLTDLAHAIFSADVRPRQGFWRLARNAASGRLSIGELMRDLWKTSGALR